MTISNYLDTNNFVLTAPNQYDDPNGLRMIFHGVDVAIGILMYKKKRKWKGYQFYGKAETPEDLKRAINLVTK